MGHRLSPITYDRLCVILQRLICVIGGPLERAEIALRTETSDLQTASDRRNLLDIRPIGFETCNN